MVETRPIAYNPTFVFVLTIFIVNLSEQAHKNQDEWRQWEIYLKHSSKVQCVQEVFSDQHHYSTLFWIPYQYYKNIPQCCLVLLVGVWFWERSLLQNFHLLKFTNCCVWDSRQLALSLGTQIINKTWSQLLPNSQRFDSVYKCMHVARLVLSVYADIIIHIFVCFVLYIMSSPRVIYILSDYFEEFFILTFFPLWKSF